MVVFFECPRCACACACTEFQIAGAIACEHCGRRVNVPRWARHGFMAGGPADAGHGSDSEGRRAFDRALIPALSPLAGRISHHIERTLGRCPMVIHHTLAPTEQLAIHIVPPQPAPIRGASSSLLHAFTLATSGLSSRLPIALPRRRSPGRLVELMISLPAPWPGLRPDGMFDHQLIRLPEYAWPIEWLKIAAGMVFGHPPDPAGALLPEKGRPHFTAPGTGFTGLLLAPSMLHPKSTTLMIHDDLTVHFLALWPLYAEELRLARRKGPRELLARFTAKGVTDTICPTRINVA